MKKSTFLIILLTVILVGCLIFKLSHNKAILDKARKPEDRSKIAIAITADTVTMNFLNDEIQYPAMLQPFDEAKIYAQTNGLISSLHIILGQKVYKGEVLGRIDTRILNLNLQQAEIDAKIALSNKIKLHEDYERANDLYLHNAGLQTNMTTAANNYENAVAQYENAINRIQLNKQQIKNAAIIAPLDGTISCQTVKNGEYVSSAAPIANITNIDKLKTTVFVPQETAYKLKVGTIGFLHSDIFGGKELQAKIIYISPQSDVNHNYQVDLIVTNMMGLTLRAGTDVVISFKNKAVEKSLLLSNEAIMHDKERPYVYVIENGKAIAKIVEIKANSGNLVAIRRGLTLGQIVATSGQINLNNGSKVSIIKK